MSLTRDGACVYVNAISFLTGTQGAYLLHFSDFFSSHCAISYITLFPSRGSTRN